MFLRDRSGQINIGKVQPDPDGGEKSIASKTAEKRIAIGTSTAPLWDAGSMAPVLATVDELSSRTQFLATCKGAFIQMQRLRDPAGSAAYTGEGVFGPVNRHLQLVLQPPVDAMQ